jgi:predicted glutamine amidotransferase
MCRFLFYAGTPVCLDDLLFRPKYSLIQQSTHAREREEPLNGDGFGLAWWAPGSPVPGLFRSVSPAWSNENLQSLARVTRSPRVMGHVRAASEGLSVYEGNCHPFVCDELALMHNGDLAGFRADRRRLLAELSDRAFATIQGYTDSEFLFALFLDRYWARAKAEPALDAMRAALSDAIVRAAELTDRPDGPRSYFNVVVSNGREAVAARATTDRPERAESLHVHTGGIYRVVAGVCRMVAPTDGKGAVIVSSEELSDDPGWRKVAPNHVLSIASDGTVADAPLPPLLASA